MIAYLGKGLSPAHVDRCTSTAAVCAGSGYVHPTVLTQVSAGSGGSNYLVFIIREREREQWAVYYTSTQSFIIMFSYLLA